MPHILVRMAFGLRNASFFIAFPINQFVSNFSRCLELNISARLVDGHYKLEEVEIPNLED